MLADDLRIRVKGTLTDALDKGWNEDEWTNAVLLAFADHLHLLSATNPPGEESWRVDVAFDEAAEQIEEVSRVRPA